MYNFQIDKNFLDKYEWNLQQIFLYVNDECQLRCKHCLVKPNLDFKFKREFDLEKLKKLLSDFKKMWAVKLTILWWEPTLYSKLTDLIEYSKDLWFQFITIDTNWLFDSKLLDNSSFKKLDDISFSIDWYNNKTHWFLRWNWVLLKTLNNLKQAIEKWYNVSVTTCIHRGLIDFNETEPELRYKDLKETILFLEKLWIYSLNFHVLLPHWMPISTWSEGTDISIDEWMKIKLFLLKIKNKLKIDIRIPTHFINKNEYKNNKEYYDFCTLKISERVLLTVDWLIRNCAGFLGSKYHVARFEDNKITWNYDENTNEYSWLNSKCKWCPYQFKDKNIWELVPLCFSLKPNQKEFIWVNKLKWDLKK